MALPTDAVAIAEPMDPTDLLPWEADMSSYLEDGQEIASYTLALYPDAALLGLSILSAAPRAPVLLEDDSVIQFWLEVDPGHREDPAFSSAGLVAGILVTIETNSVPLKRRQRTFAVTVRQR
mgnify:CR=1 FL=1